MQATSFPFLKQLRPVFHLAAICLALLLCSGCDSNSGSSSSSSNNSPESTDQAVPVFEDLAAASGLVFHHDSGATGEFYMPEIMGAGIALLDYDNDGDLDVFVLQGKRLELKDAGRLISDGSEEPVVETQGHKITQVAGDPEQFAGHRLFRNELKETGKLEFRDVTEAAGLLSPDGEHGYGMGVAVGDIDNDGDLDLYVTHFGPNALYTNDGEGKFQQVLNSGTEHNSFSSSAAFLDYDSDGLLDLYVANYNTFSLTNHQACRSYTGPQDYCDPLAYQPAVDRLFRNLGEGKFEDVTASTGVDQQLGTGLGVIAADFNSDGALDIYVANDKMANHYWINDGNGGFTDDALMSGAAYSGDGVAEASMGVVAGDVDGDGDDDLFMTHLNGQTNTLYLNDGSGRFRDSTSRMNLGVSSLQFTGFGTIWIDYDNDGDHDLLIANGAVLAQETARNDRLAHYAQRNQIYRNDGSGRFEDMSSVAGESFQQSRISRGVAVGDIDNDGDLDSVISNADGLVELLINQGAAKKAQKHWLSVMLRGVVSNRHGIGARVVLLRENGDRLWRRAHSDGSYLSANDHRVHFGLADDPEIQGIGVVWPTGQRELYNSIDADSFVELVEGTGQPWQD